MAKSKYKGKKSDIDSYRKERRRILNYINRQSKKEGYDVSKISVPSIPKRITAGSVRRLQKLDLDYLRKNITYVNIDTGELTSINNTVKLKRLKKEFNEAVAKSEERSWFESIEYWLNNDPSKLKPETIKLYYERKNKRRSLIPDGLNTPLNKINTKAVLRGFEREVAETNNEYAYEHIMEWLDNWISTFGEKYVAETLEQASREGIRLEVTESDSYPSAIKKSNKYISKIMVLSGEYDEEILDAIMSDMGLIN